MADDDTALEAMLAHHRALTAGLRSRQGALAGAVAAGAPHHAPLGEMVAFLADEILPHTRAEEATIYRTAIELQQAALTEGVLAMVDEHRQFEAATTTLASTDDGDPLVRLAAEITDLFDAHVAKENEVVLPALNDRHSLSQLLRQMHRYLETHETAASVATADRGLDEVVGALVEALDRVAVLGEPDRACRLAASAWRAIHHDRPDLGRRLTAALHHLARKTDNTAAGEHSNTPVPVDAPTTREAPELDVREVPPARRHQIIFTAYHALPPAGGFVLVNDHDPKPLRYQFEAEHRDEFTWQYLQSGPRVWKVRIGKAPLTATPRR